MGLSVGPLYAFSASNLFGVKWKGFGRKGLPRHLLGQSEETHEKLRRGQTTSGSTFEPRTSRIKFTAGFCSEAGGGGFLSEIGMDNV